MDRRTRRSVPAVRQGRLPRRREPGDPGSGRRGRTDDGTFDLLWGWDNASFLYRVTADDSTNPVLTLDRSPVDDYPPPARRAGGPGAALGRRARHHRRHRRGLRRLARTATPAVLAAPYDPDTKTVQFPAALPATYTDPDETPQLYLRVWEQLLPGNALGDEIALDRHRAEGDADDRRADASLHVGDFWTIGVRPSTPDTVLPARYSATPQPPDGPRMWACPLAVIGWPTASSSSSTTAAGRTRAAGLRLLLRA